MAGEAYSVSIVVCREFTGDLAQLLRIGPVWIVNSPMNRQQAETVWGLRPTASHPDGVTVFDSKEETSLEDRLIWNMDVIDLHHGIYSASPPYRVINVIGTVSTPKIESHLAEYGFDSFEPTADGFRATRPLPDDSELRGV